MPFDDVTVDHRSGAARDRAAPNPQFIDADTLTGQMRPIRRCVFSLGSNVGDRLANLQGGLDSLADAPSIWPVAVSPVYETAPVGGPDQDDFLNAVAARRHRPAGPDAARAGLAVEDAYGRERPRERRRARSTST